jgi:hypothetical protein
VTRRRTRRKRRTNSRARSPGARPGKDRVPADQVLQIAGSVHARKVEVEAERLGKSLDPLEAQHLQEAGGHAFDLEVESSDHRFEGFKLKLGWVGHEVFSLRFCWMRPARRKRCSGTLRRRKPSFPWTPRADRNHSGRGGNRRRGREKTRVGGAPASMRVSLLLPATTARPSVGARRSCGHAPARESIAPPALPA